MPLGGARLGGVVRSGVAGVGVVGALGACGAIGPLGCRDTRAYRQDSSGKSWWMSEGGWVSAHRGLPTGVGDGGGRIPTPVWLQFCRVVGSFGQSPKGRPRPAGHTRPQFCRPQLCRVVGSFGQSPKGRPRPVGHSRPQVAAHMGESVSLVVGGGPGRSRWGGRGRGVARPSAAPASEPLAPKLYTKTKDPIRRA